MFTTRLSLSMRRTWWSSLRCISENFFKECAVFLRSFRRKFASRTEKAWKVFLSDALIVSDPPPHLVIDVLSSCMARLGFAPAMFGLVLLMCSEAGCCRFRLRPEEVSGQANPYKSVFSPTRICRTYTCLLTYRRQESRRCRVVRLGKTGRRRNRADPTGLTFEVSPARFFRCKPDCMFLSFTTFLLGINSRSQAFLTQAGVALFETRNGD